MSKNLKGFQAPLFSIVANVHEELAKELENAFAEFGYADHEWAKLTEGQKMARLKTLYQYLEAKLASSEKTFRNMKTGKPGIYIESLRSILGMIGVAWNQMSLEDPTDTP